VNKILGGLDLVAVDAAGCRLLGLYWRKIDQITLANGVLARTD